ncbi:hypothetical protein D3C84_457730 [compost metagenome]
MAQHPLVLRLIDQGAHFHVRVERIGHPDRFGAGLQAQEEFIRQFIGHQYPAGGGTHLPGVEKTTAAGQFYRQVEVGIRHHQQRGFTAQFQAHALHRFRRALHDLYADHVTAGKGNLRHPWVARQRRTDRQARPADQVEHALGQAALGDDRRQFQLCQRGDFRRLEHHAATRRQGRGEFPGGGDHREVPRHDQPHHTARLAAHAGGEVVARQLDRAVQPGIQCFGEAGVIVEGGDHVIDVDPRFELWLAVVDRL